MDYNKLLEEYNKLKEENLHLKELLKRIILHIILWKKVNFHL